jgi:hypothetical protein
VKPSAEAPKINQKKVNLTAGRLTPCENNGANGNRFQKLFSEVFRQRLFNALSMRRSRVVNGFRCVRGGQAGCVPFQTKGLLICKGDGLRLAGTEDPLDRQKSAKNCVCP